MKKYSRVDSDDDEKGIRGEKRGERRRDRSWSPASQREGQNRVKSGVHLESMDKSYRLPPRQARVLVYSREELEERYGKTASELCCMDRLKFARDFNVSTLSLPEHELKIYHENPHLHQVFANKEMLSRESATRLERTLTASSGRTGYARRYGLAKTVDHWGARKLLLSEIEFLLQHNDPSIRVLYAGAAPGGHIDVLSLLFPQQRFLLVDPSTFHCSHNNEKIELCQSFFNDEFIDKLPRRTDAATPWERTLPEEVLFISDVRTLDKSLNNKEKEERVAVDMKRQQEWIEHLKPRAAMLKFRLPYSSTLESDVTNYLDGELHFPVWSGRTTTESRLVVQPIRTNQHILYPSKTYSIRDYESAMFHFQTKTRVSYYEGNEYAQRQDVGLDHCYDCTAEIHILTRYMTWAKEQVKGGSFETGTDVTAFSSFLSTQLSRTRTLHLSSLK